MPEMIPAWVNGALVPIEKTTVHLQGLRHKAVSVFVTDGTRVLIQRRALGKYHTPGLWANSCCTHPHWGERPEHCAQRRLREELGVVGLALTLADQVEYRADVGGAMTEHEIVDIFLARADQALALVPDPAEVMDTRWVALDQLAADVAQTPEIFTPWLRIYLDKHQTGIFGG
ncbi:MAG: isopentenyl-diphosphate Delta-isomerase [Rhodobacteraceae bacterium]|nr:isopentenyl-diphosphate Delta-isomerase [Paracoccaceae bacterium]MCP5341415.1 isopentenyl-diphosphate Delta-isomerase [Paracoccaceae bacterium]